MVEVICFISLSLLVWFETNAFVEYAKLLSTIYPSVLNHLYLVDYETVTQDSPMTYPDFLEEYHNCFFTRLISCPICISVQMGLFFSLFIGISEFAVLSILGLLLYKLTKRMIS